MVDGDDSFVERLSPEDAFSLVADETRFEILRTLQAADGAMAFSDLREAVDVRDSGRFNYHLDKLTDQFVHRDDDGYRIAAPGERLVGAVLSGGYTAALGDREVPVEGECLECGAPLVARFRPQGVTVECSECGTVVTNPQVPPGLVAGRDAADAPDTLGRWGHVTQAAADAGICLNCYGQLERTLQHAEAPDTPDWIADAFLGMVRDECERCGHVYNAIVQVAVLTHPAVAAYHSDHGIDLRETPIWTLPWIEPGRGSITTDPLRFAVPIPLDDETRTFVFDADLDLVATRGDDS